MPIESPRLTRFRKQPAFQEATERKTEKNLVHPCTGPLGKNHMFFTLLFL